MKRQRLNELKTKVVEDKQAKVDIEVIFAALNDGQRKQLVKVPAVQEIFERYGIEY